MGRTIGVVLALKDKCSSNLQAIAGKLGITEKEAKKLKREVQSVSKELGKNLKTAAVAGGAAIAGAFTGAVALATKAGETADRIDDLSNKIGISRKGFQEWDYLLGQNGAHVESLQMGFKKLAANIVGASTGNKNSVKIFRQLGISIKDNTGHLKNQEQVFNEAVRALQRMPEGAKKAQIANTLFGKSGSELMPLLNATNEQLEKQRETYKKLGIEISDSAIDAGNKFGDSMEKMNSAAMGITAVLGAELLPVATDVLNTIVDNMPEIKTAVIPVLQQVVGIIKFAIEHSEQLINVTKSVVIAFGAYKTITTVIAVVKTFNMIITVATGATRLFSASLMATPFGAIAFGFAGITAGIIATINAYKQWQSIKEDKELLKNNSLKSLTPDEQEKVNKYNKQKKTTPKKHATGTSYAPGGLSLVGEQGPELVNLPRGTGVTPADKTQQLLSNKQNISINIVIQGNMIGNQEFMNQLSDTFAMKLRTAMQSA